MYLLRPQLQAAGEARFMCVGMLGSVLIAAMANPAMDRLLTWIALGASVLIAQLIAPALRDPHALGAWRRATIACLLVLNAVGVLFLPSRARGNLVMRSAFDRADYATPSDPSVADKTLIFMNPPLFLYAGYTSIERAALGIPRPAAQHVLGVGATEIDIERPDAYAVRVRPRLGFILEPTSKMLWSKRHRFHVGDRIHQRDMTVTVLEVTSDARPSGIEARFVRPLEDPNYVWIQWQGARTAAFVPPAIGARLRIPALNYLEVALGFPLPLELRL